MGIGSAFPTFLSLKLRQHLHNVTDNTPTVFYIGAKINDQLEEEFYQNFEVVDQFLSPSVNYVLSKPMKINPWD
jgi:hypothetical protein